MRPFRTLFLLLLVYVVQVVIISKLSLFTIQPDLILVFISLLAVSNGAEVGFFAGGVLGFIQDIFFGTLFVNTLTKAVLGVLVGTIKESIFGTEETVAITAVVVATITEFVMQLAMFYFFLEKPIASFLVLIFVLLVSCVFNGILAFLIYPMIKSTNKFIFMEQ